MSYIKIKVTGLDKLRDKAGQFQTQVLPYLQAAGEQAFKSIILAAPGTPGNYPPATGANFPRSSLKTHRAVSYYQRGKGTWVPVASAAKLRNLSAGGYGPVTRKAGRGVGAGVAGYKLIPNSERLGTRYSGSTSTIYSEKAQTHFVATASYARYVIGDQQASAMRKIGWRKLIDVANENMSKIVKVYDAWVNKAIKDLKL